MIIKGIQEEDFINYKKPSMFIGTSICDWKCCNEQCLDKNICQNSSLANSKTIDISADEIYRRYINNPITKSIVIGGLEPMLQFSDVLELIKTFRNNDCNDDIVIKYGRYIPDQKEHYDEVLGVYLASSNQYAERISND